MVKNASGDTSGGKWEEIMVLLRQDHDGGMSPSSGQHHESENAARSIEQSHQGGSTMEAYQADQGGTVIWLESADGQYAPPNHQSHMTIVRHLDQNGEANDQGERDGHHESGEGDSSQQQHGPQGEGNPSEQSSPPKQGGDAQRKPQHGKMLRPRPMTRFQGNYNRNRVPSPAAPASSGPAPKFDDPFEAFGRYVAALLRNLHSKKGAYRLQKEIIWQILQEQMREC